MTHAIDNTHIIIYQRDYAPVVATIVELPKDVGIADILVGRVPKDVDSFIKQLSKYTDTSYAAPIALRGRPNAYLCRSYFRDAPGHFLAKGRNTIITIADL